MVSIAVFLGVAYWARQSGAPRSEVRYILIAGAIPFVVSAGTLRQLLVRQWKARKTRRTDEEPDC